MVSPKNVMLFLNFSTFFMLLENMREETHCNKSRMLFDSSSTYVDSVDF